MSNQQQLPHIPIEESEKPSEEGKRLVTIFTDMENKQLDFLNGAAKNIIQCITAMLAVLFAVTAFGDNFPPAYLKGNPPAKVLVIVTLLSYLLAMGASIWGINPRFYRRYLYNVSRLGDELKRITKHKMLWLCIAGVLFSLGSVTFSALIVSIIWTV